MVLNSAYHTKITIQDGSVCMQLMYFFSLFLFFKWKHHNYDTLIFKSLLFSATLISFILYLF